MIYLLILNILISIWLYICIYKIAKEYIDMFENWLAILKTQQDQITLIIEMMK